MGRQHEIITPDEVTRMMESTLRDLQDIFADLPQGFFVDVGANDPHKGSWTWSFEQRGWTGILVEPLPHCCEELREKRPNSRVFQVACGSPGQPAEAVLHIGKDDRFSSLTDPINNPAAVFERSVKVPVRTLDDILEECGNPAVDLLCLDTEGTELDVLRGCDLERHRPRVVVIEDTVHDLRLRKHRWLKAHGYRLVYRTTHDGWYVPREHRALDIPTVRDRLEFFRKYYLGTPLRWAKLWRHRRRLRR
ncbi:MAG: FkbM family methyltransferase [Planctomycetota bacterium]|jgi:FkbM family methyltransferase